MLFLSSCPSALSLSRSLSLSLSLSLSSLCLKRTINGVQLLFDPEAGWAERSLVDVYVLC